MSRLRPLFASDFEQSSDASMRVGLQAPELSLDRLLFDSTDSFSFRADTAFSAPPDSPLFVTRLEYLYDSDWLVFGQASEAGDRDWSMLAGDTGGTVDPIFWGPNYLLSPSETCIPDDVTPDPVMQVPGLAELDCDDPAACTADNQTPVNLTHVSFAPEPPAVCDGLDQDANTRPNPGIFDASDYLLV